MLEELSTAKGQLECCSIHLTRGRKARIYSAWPVGHGLNGGLNSNYRLTTSRSLADSAETHPFHLVRVPTKDNGMSGAGKSENLRLGFMETMEIDGRGHIGGLLITNHNGRPLEFQCTTPVKPNRTQEILFGETLRSWLLGELIGSTLLDRVSIKPNVVITSDPNLLELRNHTNIPVACATDAKSKAAEQGGTIKLGSNILRFHVSHQVDAESLSKQKHLIPDAADLAEPLERVREALSETVKTVFAR